MENLPSLAVKCSSAVEKYITIYAVCGIRPLLLNRHSCGCPALPWGTNNYRCLPSVYLILGNNSVSSLLNLF